MGFDFRHWLDRFRAEPGYNDAAGYGVYVEPTPSPAWRVLGIHHLTPDENRGNHNVFVEVLDAQGDRAGFQAIEWTWEGRRPDQAARPVYAGQKGPNEVVDLPLGRGMILSVWTQGSGEIRGLSSNHPDELGPNGEKWNSIGHHSFFVCFQEVDRTAPQPQPEPTPPGPEPPKPIVMRIDKRWLDRQPVEAGQIIIRG